MALILTKEILGRNCITRRCALGFYVASVIQRTTLLSNYDTELVASGRSINSTVSSISYEQHRNSSSRNFCTAVHPERLCWEGSSRAAMLKRLEVALKEHQVNEVWESFIDFKRLHGFPEGFLIHKLITELCYSSDPYWLQKACDLVLVNLRERSDLLQSDILTKLSLSLVRCQMPKPAMMILRLMLEKRNLPPMNVLCLVALHMVKTEIGTHLASNFLIQICHHFQCLRAKKSDHAKLLQPDTMIFNLVLDACVKFKLSLKGQQIMELMPATGVVADAHSIVIIAQIHELNGQREEIKNYKCYMDQVSAPFVQHYRQFYDSLLSLHFKFNDVVAASELILQMCDDRKSLPIKRDKKNSQRSYLVPIGSHNLNSGLNMQIFPELLQKDSVLKLEGKQELVMYLNGKLVLSNRALAKLITKYKKEGDISELSKLLLKIQKDVCSLRGSRLGNDVIHACIHLGWLETAHDILDDMETAEAPMGYSTCMSLLTAYYKRKMFPEAKALLKKMRKAGLLVNLSDEMVASTCLSVVDSTALCTSASISTSKSDLANAFIQEMRDEKEEIPSRVYQFNSSINFFCKAKMIDDALKTYKRMQELKMHPTEETFTYMINVYSSLGMFRNITFLWGDMKRNMDNGNLVVSRDLYEYLLLNFLRGGYFERVMEVINYMKEHSMFADKWMYRSEFLKLHKNLYRNLKASEARTDAQRKRLEYVQAFRKWVGID
ncbi:pentatricopeptide repeat-containing protein At4g17616 [Rosa rugosa]|uniref:pentatricopeptide repeat-containing protein At4g17616 n=1 Tax=Rosa rugosa TaxID=74645 RepID=UPI002B413DDA|nr:pentatricopeptide repeat-containing protein At4g17616 [Rosa rugosa]XP_062026594.1 pentatricopeptide repeat-containing protein At4g17616 [Rosa rugosa]XP_062026595.1 pentatricopeptide repeat-containing protein At4g17616 [Rosa rugosa]